MTSIVFMGTPDFSVPALKAIVEAGHQVTAVVTQPDKPKGRGGAMSMSPVKEAALKHNLTVLQPQRAREEAFIEELRGKSVEELNEELVAAKKELFNLRFQNATNQLDNTSRIKEVRKNIARIQTVLAAKAN